MAYKKGRRLNEKEDYHNCDNLLFYFLISKTANPTDGMINPLGWLRVGVLENNCLPCNPSTK